MKNIYLNYHNLGFSPQIGINKVHPLIFNNHIEIINNYMKKKSDTSIHITFDDAYENIYKYSFNILDRSLVSSKIIFPITDYIGKFNDWDFTFMINKYRHLGAEKIKSLSKAGWVVGSHGKTHKSLELMSDSETLIELKESKDCIEQLIGRSVDSFAPPFGFIGQRVYDLCVESGYRNIYIQKHRVRQPVNNIRIIKRQNIYSIDRNNNILMKLSGKKWEDRKESFISSFNNLTILFKKTIKK